MLPLPSLAEASQLHPLARAKLVADDRRIVIVGAGGWIGRTLMRGLYDAVGERTFRQRVVPVGSTARSVDFGDGLAVDQIALGQLKVLPACPTMLFHLAFLTKDKFGSMQRADYEAANRELSRLVLGALDPLGVDRLFLASSGAAAFADDDNANEDLRVYGALKREDEDLFAAWAADDAGRRAVITRIFSLSGPFINKHDTYALASFIKDALANQPIQVHAPMRVMRSYVSIREILSLIVMQLLEDRKPQVIHYDTGGKPLELGEVAQEVARALGGVVLRNEIFSGKDNIYTGAQEPYAEMLREAKMSQIDLCQQILDTAVTLASQ